MKDEKKVAKKAKKEKAAKEQEEEEKARKEERQRRKRERKERRRAEQAAKDGAGAGAEHGREAPVEPTAKRPKGEVAPSGGVGSEGSGAASGRVPSVVTLRSDDDWFSMLEASAEMPVVVDFSAAWCRPCAAIAPLFAELCAKHARAFFVKVDVDEMEEAAAEAGVTAMPTFHVYRHGGVVDTVEGADARRLEAMVRRAVEQPS